MLLTMDSFQIDKKQEITLYHGSTVIIQKPRFDRGRSDNDYGKGFYTTLSFDKAVAWAQNMGEDDKAFVNEYTLDLSHMKVLTLDDYGPLAWIAEIAAHRPIRSELADEFLPEFVRKYRVDTSMADVIIGYRADDSYTDVIGAFCDGLLNCDEVRRLFYKGKLGEQYFIKSRKAFDTLQFRQMHSVIGLQISKEKNEEIEARRAVGNFLNQRRIDVARRLLVQPITIVDAIVNQYQYNKETTFYEMV